MNSELNIKPTVHSALLLIDLQNDFVAGGTLAVKNGNDVIDVANELIPKFGLVVATQDWHPPDHQSSASQHDGLEVGDSFILQGLPQTAWPDHCIQGTFGADLVADLNHAMINQIFYKGTDRNLDCYSGFYDNGHKRSTGLAEFLRQKKIDSVFIMGLATDYCVRATALDAVAEGFLTTVIAASCRGVELQEGDTAAAIDAMNTAGAVIGDNSQRIWFCGIGEQVGVGCGKTRPNGSAEISS